MTFAEVLAQVRELLQSKGRVSYRALKLQFNLDDDYLEGLKDELIEAEHVAADEGGKVLVWVGDASVASSQFPVASPQPPAPSTQHPDSRLWTPNSEPISAERRQLTVMFCDLVGSTALSAQLDPEELREVVRAYQEACAGVIGRFEGHIAQYLGDGLLVYFGYPVAHEDDAQRAVRAGLEIITALQHLPHAGHEVPSPLAGEGQGEGAKVGAVVTHTPHPNPFDSAQDRLPPQGGKEKTRLTHRLQVRIGIHTGLVVVGEIGGGEKREQLALGETPNIAARVQGKAEPDSVVISAATSRLVAGLFECQDLGSHQLHGVTTPLPLYRIVRESVVQSRFEVAVRTGLTPLVGREHEVGLLEERWERAKEGEGQVVLLSGEAGIGKSRLVQVLKEQVIKEGATRIEFHCSPYHQNSALYPVIEHLQRVLQFDRGDAPHAKLEKLQVALARYRFPQADTVPLLASLLSLPHPEGSPSLTLSPQRQKQKTHEALVAWIVEEAERNVVYSAWEDLHWSDPSTLEFLGLLLDQVPTARILMLLTFRPEFHPPWVMRSHMTQVTLNRLPRKQAEIMVEEVAGGQVLPAEMVQQIVAKTDGVPLFVEELTKMVVESVGAQHAVPLPSIPIPTTLQDSLMARLDRLGIGKEVAQLGATLGREFSYELLHAVSPLDEAILLQGLQRLVEAELLYQRGLPPQARYLFKHALIQDAAYQSLLKSRRQQYHQQIARVLEQRFPETTETQPELVAHHYTEAGLIAQAIPYWQRAGQRAVERSANVEAIGHLTKGLELLKILPDTPERAQQELTLQITLGQALIAAKGYAAPEVEQVYTRARELCRRVGETPQLFPVLAGLFLFYFNRGEFQTVHELAKQLMRLAQSVQDPTLLMVTHVALGATLFRFGELVPAREHLERSIALYDPQKDHRHASGLVTDPRIDSLSYAAGTLWLLGYPDQARSKGHEALTYAQELSHPHSLVFALTWAADLHQYRREGQAAQERAEELIALATEQGFPYWLGVGIAFRGYALVEQGQIEEGLAEIHRGGAVFRATGAGVGRPTGLGRLAEAYGKVGRTEEGLTVLAAALAAAHKTGERFYEAELYRLKGQLTLRQFNVQGSKFKVANPEPLTPNTQHLTPSTQTEAEACFHKAIEIARRQQAKSWELRAVMSLSRLWQKQGKKAEAQQMLAEIYDWFTEGVDTADLKEAKALLEELA